MLRDDKGGIAHILAYCIPYPEMCLAVLERAFFIEGLVTITVLSVGLDKRLAESDPSIDNCLLISEVLEKI